MRRRVLEVDCSALVEPDLADIELLAVLRVVLRRHGCELRTVSVAADLRRLVEFAGLTVELGLEARRQSEEREQPGRVEEEGDLLDPPV